MAHTTFMNREEFAQLCLGVASLLLCFRIVVEFAEYPDAIDRTGAVTGVLGFLSPDRSAWGPATGITLFFLSQVVIHELATW
jgi:hypothetical protein